jgi:hypothetical protein
VLSPPLEDAKKTPKERLKKKQEDLFKHISTRVTNSSTRFDIDDSSNAKNSAFDNLIDNDAIQKSLESDNLIFLEGVGRKKGSLFTAEELVKVEEELNHEDNISAGDFQEEFDEKQYKLDQKSLPKSGIFERKAYFNTLFPSLKI